MLKKLLSAFISAGLICALCCGASALTVEQTQIVLPDIDVYIYEDGDDISGVSVEDVTATLGGEALRAESLSLSERGICYVYMLDVSASMPGGCFDAVRDAIADAAGRLRAQDSLVVLTFGNDVNIILRGGESAEEVRAALDALTCTDSRTALYAAMDTLVETASKTEDMRRIAIVVSDGIDDADEGITREELERRLRDRGIAVNALCIDSTSDAAAGDFRSFIHISGGELYLFGPDTAGAVLGDLLQRLSQGWLLELRAATNIVSGQTETLAIDFGGAAAVELAVTPGLWLPDDDAPDVKSAILDEETGRVLVTFSEDVSGADSPSCYTATAAGGGEIDIVSAEYEQGSLSRVLVTLGPTEGVSSMTFTASGIVDISMEKNSLTPFSRVLYLGLTATSQAAVAAADKEPLLPAGTVIIICAGVLAVAAAIAALLFITSSRRREKAALRRAERAKREAEEKKPRPANSSAVFVFDEKDKK